VKYRLSCLTPLLVGDGGKLSPIDYMVWKDQVNVLDQRRIFRLLAKGPRLDSYLTQIKKAEKLDFASWGGFAQNFAGRRIPFENPACAAHWERAHTENLHIPTFVSGPAGPYLPGSALKGALRTGIVSEHWDAGILKDTAARLQPDRPLRRPAENGEERVVGPGGTNRMKFLSVGDSAPIAVASFKVYLLRVSTLLPKGQGLYELGWKQSPKGSTDGRRPDDSTPIFAEMAAPGTAFEGTWQENGFFSQPEIVRAEGWRTAPDRAVLFEAANDYAARQLALHKQYAQWTGLILLLKHIEELEAKLAAARAQSGACLLNLGWGGGLFGKSAWLDTSDDSYRRIVRQLPLYNRAIESGLPFPKTRRIVFLNNQPATLPGWTLLELE
jgi:CRISPR-associated protein Csm5